MPSAQQILFVMESLQIKISVWIWLDLETNASNLTKARVCLAFRLHLIRLLQNNYHLSAGLFASSNGNDFDNSICNERQRRQKDNRVQPVSLGFDQTGTEWVLVHACMVPTAFNTTRRPRLSSPRLLMIISTDVTWIKVLIYLSWIELNQP